MMQQVLQWLRQNAFSVGCLAVMVAAAVAMPIVGGKLNARVRKDVEQRAARYGELESLEKTPIELPGDASGQSNQVLVNQALLIEYGRVVDALKSDADEIYHEAVRFNRKDRTVLLPRLFPDPPWAERETLPKDFWGEVQAGYDRLLARLNTGMPPDPADVAVQLERRQTQFIMDKFAAQSLDQLDDEQRRTVRAELANTRLSRYAQAAGQISFYLDPAIVKLPPQGTRLPTMAELYEWQWQYWIHEDLLQALADANRGSDSVINAPVKRVLELAVRPEPYVQSAGGAAAAGPAKPPSFGGGSKPGRRATPGSSDEGAEGEEGDGAAPATAAGGAPVDPRPEVPRDYSVSLTGRRTNPLYDVRLVSVSLIVDPQHLPAVINALAKRNFITVLDMVVEEGDAYADLAQGYFYYGGPGTVANVWLELETIWLRSWTREFMPESVRAALGIAPPVAPEQG
jgi:hypothetical protein